MSSIPPNSLTVPSSTDNQSITSSTTIPTSTGDIKFNDKEEITASFTGISNKNTDPATMILPDLLSSPTTTTTTTTAQGISVKNSVDPQTPLPTPLHEHQQQQQQQTQQPSALLSSETNNNNVQSSPLLSSTPPTVSKSLIKSYPYLLFVLKLLNILTWTDDENGNYISLLIVLINTISILYYETIIIYFGHLLPVISLWIYSLSSEYIKRQYESHSTLDDVVQSLTNISQKTDLLISSISSLNLTANDLKRLLFTTIFLSPAYIIISFFVLRPKTMFLIISNFLLTYHSKWSKVTRRLLWKSKTFRLLCFYVTGLDFELQHSNKNSLFNLANKKIKSKLIGKNNPHNLSSVRFTYVLYENQRRWLGVGWTPNLLSYERTPWTDEFLNESESIETFELPVLTDDSGMNWNWIDKTWRLDVTNDGSIQLSSTKAKTTANPKSDEGWIYYDNTWKNPGTEDGFSKYTRRRRWIRTAELVNNIKSSIEEENNDGEKINVLPNSAGIGGVQQRKKSIRFDEKPKVSFKDDEVSDS